MTNETFTKEVKHNSSYLSAKESMLSQMMTTHLLGIPLTSLGSFNEDTIPKDRKRLLLPIMVGCICVQDTPQNPCPCKTDPPVIIWIPYSDILKSGKSDKLNHDGEALFFFEVKTDTVIFIEHLKKIPASKIHQMTMRRNRFTNSVVANAKIKPKTAVGLAFTLGTLLGEYIDEKTGASDELADWMYDTFGPWPF